MATSPETDDFLADARKRMVDSQIRPNKVSNPGVVEAMRRLPRERFLPATLAALAYADQNVNLGGGRVLLQPMVLARLMQAATPAQGEKVLVIGAGCGYSSALLAALGCEVTALEEPGLLRDLASAALASVAPAVHLVSGPLAAGWAASAPYDLIVIDGAVPAVPAAIVEQLNRSTGRLVTILDDGEHSGHAVHAEPTRAGVSARPLFDCRCPVLPAFAPAPVFAF